MTEENGSKNQQALESVAWGIYSAERRPVHVSDTERKLLQGSVNAGLLVESSEGLQFSDELVMVEYAAQYAIQNESTLLLSSPKACFKRLSEIWSDEIGGVATVSGHILAALHNGGHVDAYEWGREAIESGANVFDILHVMAGGVLLLDYSQAEPIYDFFTGHYDQVKNDLAGGHLYAKLPEWFSQNPDVSHELKQLYELNPQEAGANIYGCALQGLISHNFEEGFGLALAASQSRDPLIAGPTIHTLGLIDYSITSSKKAIEQVIHACSEILDRGDEPLLGNVVSTLGKLVTLNEVEIINLLSKVGKGGVPVALYALSEMLWLKREDLVSQEWYWPLFLHLKAAEVDHGGTLRNIDMVLADYVKDSDQQTRLFEFLNAWIAKQPIQSLAENGIEKYFSSTFHELVQEGQFLNKVITSWLLEDDARFPLIVQKSVSHIRAVGGTSITLDPVRLDTLEQNEIRFLLRRILGYITGDEVQIPLIFSLVHTHDAPTRTFQWVVDVLRDQVGYDYPHQVIQFLEVQLNDQDMSDDIKILCRAIVEVLQRQLDELGALPRLKEFLPSSSKERRFNKERWKQMSKAVEEGRKESVLLQFTSQVTLKAGRQSFQSIDNRYTEPMTLKNISHSIAIPRSEVTDPAKAAQERLKYRSATRDME